MPSQSLTGGHLRWEPLIHRTVQEDANRSNRHLPCNALSHISYPQRLSQQEHGARLYSAIVTSDTPGPFFLINAALQSPTELLCSSSATFIVPLRQPPRDASPFFARWLPDVAVFLVEHCFSVPVGVQRFEDGTKSARVQESSRGVGLAEVCQFNETLPRHSDRSLQAALSEEEIAELLKLDQFDWGDEIFTDPMLVESESRNEQDHALDFMQQTDTKRNGEVSSVALLEHNMTNTDMSCDPGPVPPTVVLPITALSNPVTDSVTAAMFLEYETIFTDDSTGLSHDGQPADILPLSCAAGDEILWQQRCMARDPGIHHFNWLGRPVSERSHTPPEVSLVVITSSPKPWMHDISRAGAMMRQALTYVDPVLFKGDKSILSRFRGHALMQALRGRVCQFYTPNGTWQKDQNGHCDIEPWPDPGHPRAYLTSPWLIVTGWLGSDDTPTRFSYMRGSSAPLIRPRVRRSASSLSISDTA
ncbi:hypothetical protein LOZ14_002643 [Ophidiomyces ophidiicola]|nr:hypothetical protein LOZ14_002643 [Ophidiomyces ophidiicola]